MTHLAALADETQTAMLLLVHPTKDHQPSASATQTYAAMGSADWQNGARTSITLQHPPKDEDTPQDTVQMVVVKSNWGKVRTPDGEWARMRWLRRSDNVGGFVVCGDAYHPPRSTATGSRAEPGPAPSLRPVKQEVPASNGANNDDLPF